MGREESCFLYPTCRLWHTALSAVWLLCSQALETDTTATLLLKRHREASSTSLRMMSWFHWSDPGGPYFCAVSQPSHTGEQLKQNGSHHLHVSIFNGSVFCSNSELPGINPICRWNIFMKSVDSSKWRCLPDSCWFLCLSNCKASFLPPKCQLFHLNSPLQRDHCNPFRVIQYSILSEWKRCK